MKFSGYIGYDTRNNLEHFENDAFNPFGTGFIFLFFGSVFVSNITEYIPGASTKKSCQPGKNVES